MNSNHHNFVQHKGFSLVEAVVVIAVSGIIVAAVALFIRAPITGYVDTAFRAELTDIADTALRRIGRDLRTALPNSIRVTSVGSVYFLEYLEVRTGGRYRAGAHTGGATATVCPNDDTRAEVTDNDILSFYASPSVLTDTCFKTLGNIPNRAQIGNCSPVCNADYVVVFNLGIPGASAYESPNTNKSLISGTSTSGNEDRIAFTAQTFRYPSPGNRFHVITGPVSYVCDPVSGTLRRYSGYAIQASQPNSTGAAPLSTAPVNALLASHVSACSFTYQTAVVAQRDGLVTMSLGVTEVDSQGKNETVTLYESAHVSNVP
jgi:MSHA biogenesis protein MshO